MKILRILFFVPFLFLACDISGGTETIYVSLSSTPFDGAWSYSRDVTETFQESSVITIADGLSEFVLTFSRYDSDRELRSNWGIRGKGRAEIDGSDITVYKDLMYMDGYWYTAEDYFEEGVASLIASGNYTQTEAEEIYNEDIAPIILTLSSDETTLTTEDADGNVLEYTKQ